MLKAGGTGDPGGTHGPPWGEYSLIGDSGTVVTTSTRPWTR